uniref:C3H1-type domain-containing protein n=1 Tax=Elaeophora elaphi TaxID=1147741 RepID=A0A0R3RR56_9BILA
MTTVFPHSASGDPAMSYQLSEVPPQPIPFIPAPLSVMPPPQGTVYFHPPYIFPSGLPQAMICEQPSVPPSLENTTREVPTNDNAGTVQGVLINRTFISDFIYTHKQAAPELSPNAVFYPPPPLPIPFPPPVHPFPLFNPYVRPSPVFFVVPPFSDTAVPGNPLPPLPPPPPSACPRSVLQPLPSSFASASYQNWPVATANPTPQSPTVRMTPRKDSILSTGTNQSSFKFAGNDDCRNFQRDNTNRNESMYRNRSGPSLNNYRTKLCINFKNGHCPYGDKCRFIHQQTSDGIIKTKFSTNAPAFVPRANAMHPKPNSPSASLDIVPSNRLYSSTPISLLAKGQGSGLDAKERPTTPTGRRVSYRQDFSAGYRRPSVADGPHPLPAC